VPDFPAAAQVERAHDAELEVGAAVIADRRADDGDVAGDRRRRGHLVVGAAAQAYAFPQRHFAVLAEVLAALAAARIDREQARVDAGEDDALGAGAAIGVRVAPVTDAA